MEENTIPPREDNFENWYMKGKVEHLGVKHPLNALGRTLEELEANPQLLVPVTFEEYLAQDNKTIKRFSSDGFWIKGIGFTRQGQKDFEVYMEQQGYIEYEDWFLFAKPEVSKELAKPEWISEDDT